jgi:uncharacterized protein
MVAQSAPNSLAISEQDRWGAPLADMFRRVLTQDLIQRVPEGQVITPEGTAPNGTKLVAIDILKFSGSPMTLWCWMAAGLCPPWAQTTPVYNILWH